MSDKITYYVPAESIETEQEIKKSRFIASVSRVLSKNDAISFINQVKSKYPDARHHCYAYIAGNPFSTTDIGMSDDGEPQGTAGKPMLTVLQYRKIGEIIAVVTRYFGGTKLGTGGLLRAYSGSVQIALDKLKLMEFRILVSASITIPFQFENSVRYVFEKLDVNLIKVSYNNKVDMIIEFSEDISQQLIQELNNQTQGKIEFKDLVI